MTKHIKVSEPQRLEDYLNGYYEGSKTAEVEILQDLYCKIKDYGREAIDEILDYINARYKQEDINAPRNH